MSKRTEQSIKSKLKNISKELNTPFNSLLETLFLERILVRIGKSKYADKLIFKGGMCLAQFIKLGRETKDIDFLLTQYDGSIETVKKVFTEVAAIDAGDDFTFSLLSVFELSIEHKKYPGYRISLQGELGQIKNRISIDIGFGDVVTPGYVKVDLMKTKKHLFEDSVSLKSYPPEYIFSEKYEAILHHGVLNSRMKDYYDCYRIIQESVLNETKLKQALIETTSNRGTKLTLISGDTEVFEKMWKNFIKGVKVKKLDLKEIILTINTVIKRIIS